MVYTEELFYQAVKLVENVCAQITSNTCVHVGFTASKMKCLDAIFCCETDLSEWQESLYWFSCRDLAKGSKCVKANFREIAKNINRSSSTSMKLTFESKYATVV